MDFNSFDTEYLYNLPVVMKTKLELFMSELHIMFATEKGSVFGNRTFGNSVEHYLWSTSYNAMHIESQITQNITDSCSTNTYFNWEVNFNVTKGISKDIGVIDVIIKDNDENSVLANPQWIFK